MVHSVTAFCLILYFGNTIQLQQYYQTETETPTNSFTSRNSRTVETPYQHPIRGIYLCLQARVQLALTPTCTTNTFEVQVVPMFDFKVEEMRWRQARHETSTITHLQLLLVPVHLIVQAFNGGIAVGDLRWSWGQLLILARQQAFCKKRDQL